MFCANLPPRVWFYWYVRNKTTWAFGFLFLMLYPRPSHHSFLLSREQLLQGTVTGCPEKLWIFLLWKCWMGLWAILSSGRSVCPWQGLGTKRLLRHLSTQTILWFLILTHSKQAVAPKHEQTQCTPRKFFSLKLNLECAVLICYSVLLSNSHSG